MVLASRTFLTQVRLQTGSVTPQDTNHCTSSIKIEKKKIVLAFNDISGVSDVFVTEQASVFLLRD